MGFFKETKNSQTYYVSYPKNNPLISIILIKIQYTIIILLRLISRYQIETI